jgi:hypothetical protein
MPDVPDAPEVPDDPDDDDLIMGRTWQEWQNIRDILDLRTEKIDVPDGHSGAYLDVDGHSIHKAVVAINNKVCDEHPPVITIDGPEQTGKSNLAMIIAHQLHHVLDTCHGDWTAENLIYSPEDFASAIVDMTAQTIIIDEAGRQANANDHQSIENRALEGIVATQGFRKNIPIIIDPDISRIHKPLRDKPYIHIDVRSPGTAKPRIRKRVRSSPQEGSVYSTILLSTWNFGYAPQKIQDEYRPKELRYKGQLPKSYAAKIRAKIKEEESGESLSEI